MDNQHRKIKGYRDLSQAEIDAMNEIKEMGAKVGELVEKVRGLNANDANAETHTDQRWAAIAATDLQKGFMALTRSIAKPTTF